MPTYDYKCIECEEVFEKILKIADREEPTKNPCPFCEKSDTVELCLTAPSLVNPLRIDGLKKPSGQFRDRMKQIKSGMKYTKNTIKDF